MRVTKQKIDALKSIYRLLDWTIRTKRSTANRDACAELKSRPRYKSATIITYPTVIRRVRRDFPEEGERASLHHEFAEIVVAEAQDIVPEKYHDEAWFIAYQDACAERIARIVMELTQE